MLSLKISQSVMKLVRELRGCIALEFSFVRCLNVFITVKELWEGFETTKVLTLCRPSWVAVCRSFGERSVGGVNYLYNPSHLGLFDERELIGYSLHSQVRDVGGSFCIYS